MVEIVYLVYIISFNCFYIKFYFRVILKEWKKYSCGINILSGEYLWLCV